jgi:hypothetical protein
MNKVVAGALAWLGFGCSMEEVAPRRAEAPIGQTARAPSRSVFVELELERSTGERVAGTSTQLDMLQPVRFSSRTAEGADVEVEIFAEPGEARDGGETYRVALVVEESDSSGKVVKWRPSFNLATGNEGVATVEWGTDGRRLRVLLTGQPRAPEDVPQPAARPTTAPVDDVPAGELPPVAAASPSEPAAPAP